MDVTITKDERGVWHIKGARTELVCRGAGGYILYTYTHKGRGRSRKEVRESSETIYGLNLGLDKMQRLEAAQ